MQRGNHLHTHHHHSSSVAHNDDEDDLIGSLGSTDSVVVHVPASSAATAAAAATETLRFDDPVLLGDSPGRSDDDDDGGNRVRTAAQNDDGDNEAANADDALDDHMVDDCLEALTAQPRDDDVHTSTRGIRHRQQPSPLLAGISLDGEDDSVHPALEPLMTPREAACVPVGSQVFAASCRRLSAAAAFALSAAATGGDAPTRSVGSKAARRDVEAAAATTDANQAAPPQPAPPSPTGRPTRVLAPAAGVAAAPCVPAAMRSATATTASGLSRHRSASTSTPPPAQPAAAQRGWNNTSPALEPPSRDFGTGVMRCGLPAALGAAYAAKGVSNLYPWQAACIRDYYRCCIDASVRVAADAGAAAAPSTRSASGGGGDTPRAQRSGASAAAASPPSTRAFFNENLLYMAPTSGGKTIIAELVTFRTILGIDDAGGPLEPRAAVAALAATPLRATSGTATATTTAGASHNPNQQQHLHSALQLHQPGIETAMERKVLFVVPYVAIAEEKADYFTNLASSVNKKVAVHAGSKGQRKLAGDVLVCTAEKANVLLGVFADAGRLDEIGTVIIDELHQIGEGGRGHVVELLVTKLLHIRAEQRRRHEQRLATLRADDAAAAAAAAAMADEAGGGALATATTATSAASGLRIALRAAPHLLRIVGMTATLSNARALAKWLDDAVLFATDFRPVPLKEHYTVLDCVYDAMGRELRRIPLLSDRALARMGGPKPPVAASGGGSSHHDGHDPVWPPPFAVALKVALQRLPAQQRTGYDGPVLALAAEAAQHGHQCLIFCPTRAACVASARAVAEFMVKPLAFADVYPEAAAKLQPPPAPPLTAAAARAAGLPANAKDLVALQRSDSLQRSSTSTVTDTAAGATTQAANPLAAFAPVTLLSLCSDRIAAAAGLRAASARELRAASPDPNGSVNADSVSAAGAAFHSAGLTTAERATVERGFRDGAIWTLCCTTTLAAGVNLPVRRVIFRSPKIANGPLDTTNYRQASGRAGRTGLDAAGESYVVGLHQDRRQLQALVEAVLPPVTSNFASARRGYDRVLLEAFCADAIADVPSVRRLITASLYAATNGHAAAFDAAAASLRRLEELGLLRWVPADVDSDDDDRPVGGEAGSRCPGVAPGDGANGRFALTDFGSAVAAAAMAPEDALVLRSDLEATQRSFVLSDDLHLVFVCTPPQHSLEPDWAHLYDLLSGLNESGQRVAAAVGIDEGYAARAAQLPPPRWNPGSGLTSVGRLQLTHRRFYAALALRDVVREVPQRAVAARFKVAVAEIHKLMEAACAFASMLSTFCDRMGWWALPPLLDRLVPRLQRGVASDIVPLMRIRGLAPHRARLLFRRGYKTVLAVAMAAPDQLLRAMTARDRSGVALALADDPAGDGDDAGGANAVSDIAARAERLVRHIIAEAKAALSEEAAELAEMGTEIAAAVRAGAHAATTPADVAVALRRDGSGSHHARPPLAPPLPADTPNKRGGSAATPLAPSRVTPVAAVKSPPPLPKRSPFKPTTAAAPAPQPAAVAVAESMPPPSPAPPGAATATGAAATGAAATTSNNVASAPTAFATAASTGATGRHSVGALRLSETARCETLADATRFTTGTTAVPPGGRSAGLADSDVATAAPTPYSYAVVDCANDEQWASFTAAWDGLIGGNNEGSGAGAGDGAQRLVGVNIAVAYDTVVGAAAGPGPPPKRIDAALACIVPCDGDEDDDDVRSATTTTAVRTGGGDAPGTRQRRRIITFVLALATRALQALHKPARDAATSAAPAAAPVLTACRGLGFLCALLRRGDVSKVMYHAQRQLLTLCDAVQHVDWAHATTCASNRSSGLRRCLTASQDASHALLCDTSALMDPLVADWMLAPDDRAGGRITGLHSLCHSNSGITGGADLAVFVQHTIASPPKHGADRAARDAACALILMTRTLLPKLMSLRLLHGFVAVEMPVVGTLAAMELTGIALNPDVYRHLLQRMKERRAALCHEAFAETGRSDWSLASPQQCAVALFDTLKLPALEATPAAGAGARARRRETRSTKKEVLRLLQRMHPTVRLPFVIQEFRTLEGWDEKFLSPLLQAAAQSRLVPWRLDPASAAALCRSGARPRSSVTSAVGTASSVVAPRVFGDVYQTATATGRLAMSDPSLQTIPHPVTFRIGADMVVPLRPRAAFGATDIVRSGLAASSPFKQRPSVATDATTADGDDEADDDDGYTVLLSADYAQIEARLLAHYSQDPLLLDAFRNADKVDVFVALAARLFGRRPALEAGERGDADDVRCISDRGGGAATADDASSTAALGGASTAAAAPTRTATTHSSSSSMVGVTPTMRAHAKTLCYGIIYGRGAASIADEHDLTMDAAESLVNDFRRTYRGVTTWTDDVIKAAARDGYVETVAKRRRWLDGINSNDGRRRAAAQRMGVNALVQGSAADVVKIAMARVTRQLRAAAVSEARARRDDQHTATAPPLARLLVQVHDELLFEVRRRALPRVVRILRECMCERTTLGLTVPLPVKIRVGTTWDDLKLWAEEAEVPAAADVG